MIMRIALRNIMRHRRRTFLSALTIAAGLIVFVYMNSLMVGMDRAVIDNIINLTSSSVRISTRSYDQDRKMLPLEYGLDSVGSIAALARTLPQVRGVTARTQFMGQITSGAEITPVVGTVIDPRTDTTVFSFGSSLEGGYFSQESETEILLGKRLAEDLGVTVGDFVTIYARTRYESNNADEFRVVGLINTTDPSVNRAAVYISVAAGQQLLDLDGLVTELALAVTRRTAYADFTADVREVQATIAAAYPDLHVVSFEQIAADILQISKAKRVGGIIMLSFILLIAAVGIFNTVFMSAYERIREIGVLRAHGMPPRQVMWLFLFEGIFTGIAGSVLGVVGGAAVNWYMVVHGFAVDAMMGEEAAGSLPFYGTIYAEWDLTTYVFVVAFSMIIAVAAGIVPARRAARIEVTEALRFV